MYEIPNLWTKIMATIFFSSPSANKTFIDKLVDTRYKFDGWESPTVFSKTNTYYNTKAKEQRG